MRKGSRRISRIFAGVALLAAAALTVASFFTSFLLDCSGDRRVWCCGYLQNGCVTLAYMNRAMPPGLGAGGVPAYYRGLQDEYAGRWALYAWYQRSARYGDKDSAEVAEQWAPLVTSQRRQLTMLIATFARQRGVLGFFGHVSMRPDREVVVRFPLWFLLLLVIAATTRVIWWKRRARPPAHCARCGYDLTGNVSGICPECGTAIDGRGRATSTKEG